MIDPAPLTGRETPAQLLQESFPAFAGRGMREAHRLLRQGIVENHTVFLTVSGAMTPAGLHQSCIIPLIKSGAISCLTTTGANLYHDLHRTLGHIIHEVNPLGDDRKQVLLRLDLGRQLALRPSKPFGELVLVEQLQR